MILTTATVCVEAFSIDHLWDLAGYPTFRRVFLSGYKPVFTLLKYRNGPLNYISIDPILIAVKLILINNFLIATMFLHYVLPTIATFTEFARNVRAKFRRK
jgi:hypothetical protein